MKMNIFKIKRTYLVMAVMVVSFILAIWMPFSIYIGSSGGLISLSLQRNEVLASESEVQYPDAYVNQTNLDGTISDIDEDADSPDANWADAVDDSLNILAHVSFPSPTGNLTTGAGVQNFKIYARRSTANATPTIYADLYEGGVYKAHTSLTATNVTSDSGELFTGTWDASDLSNIDGSGVEAYIYGTVAASSGAGNTTAQYPTNETSLSSSPHSDNDWEVTGELGSNDDTYTSIEDNSYDSGDQTYLLKVNGFDFSSVPEGATIVGIEVNIAGYYSVSSSDYDYMKLMDTNGSPVGDDVLIPGGVSLQSSETTSTFGNSTTLWGNELTDTWVKDSDFGVCFGMIATSNNANIYLDWLTMKVYYSLTPDYSSVDIGAVEWNVSYEIPAEITNTPSSYDFGNVSENSTYYTGLDYFELTNSGEVEVDITIYGTDMSGGNTWTLSDTATPAEDIVGFYSGWAGSLLRVGFSGGDTQASIGFSSGDEQETAGPVGQGDYSIIVKKNATYNTLIYKMPVGAIYNWGLKILTPTVFTDGVEKSGNITVSATAS